MTTFSRRDFIKKSSTLMAAAVAFQHLPTALKTEKPIGIQLYSLREDIDGGNLEDVLETIAKIGYQFVEGYGYKEGKIFGVSPADFRKKLKEYELKLTSSHAQFLPDVHFDDKAKDVSDAFKKLVEDSLKMGQRFLICPSMPQDVRTDMSVFKAYCEKLEKAGAHCKTLNLQFGYHNHEFEFKTKLEGKSLYDTMLESLTPENVTMELDIAWAVYAGINTVELFEKYPRRFQLAHFKDLAEEGEKTTTILGEGVIDFEAILPKMSKGGIRQIIVELEDYNRAPLDDVKGCYKNLRKMLDKLD